jgi:hypothetical protein
VTYAAPTGTLSTDSYITALTTEGASTDGNIEYTSEAAPTELYNVIPSALTVAPGSSFTVKANFGGDKAAERTARLYIDRNGDGKFGTSEKISTTTPGVWNITMGSALKQRKYRIRIVIDDSTSSTTDITSGVVYDFDFFLASITATSANEYTTPSGTMHADGQAYLASLSTSGAEEDVKETWSECPSTVYNLVDQTLKVEPGQKFTLNLNAFETSVVSDKGFKQDLRFNYAVIFADWYGNCTFTQIASYGARAGASGFDNTDGNLANSMNIAHEMSVPSDAKAGTGRIRIIYQNAWKDVSSANLQDIYEGISYDIPVEIGGTNGLNSDLNETLYFTPDGTIHSEKKAYLTAITSEGADVNINATWSESPLSVYNLVDQEITARAGSDFTLNLTAYKGGPSSTSTIYQDMRYNYATIFTDWNAENNFISDAVYGRRAGTTGFNDVKGNYSYVLDIAHTVSIPADAADGHTRIRVIYQNAWKDLSGPNAQDIYEGMAYDIPVYVVGSSNEIVEISLDGKHNLSNGIFDLQGRKLNRATVPGIYIINGKKTFVK